MPEVGTCQLSWFILCREQRRGEEREREKMEATTIGMCLLFFTWEEEEEGECESVRAIERSVGIIFSSYLF